MLLRSKKVTVMAYWEERKLGNLKPTRARVSVKREKHGRMGEGADCSDHWKGLWL